MWAGLLRPCYAVIIKNDYETEPNNDCIYYETETEVERGFTVSVLSLTVLGGNLFV